MSAAMHPILGKFTRIIHRFSQRFIAGGQGMAGVGVKLARQFVGRHEGTPSSDNQAYHAAWIAAYPRQLLSAICAVKGHDDHQHVVAAAAATRPSVETRPTAATTPDPPSRKSSCAPPIGRPRLMPRAALAAIGVVGLRPGDRQRDLGQRILVGVRIVPRPVGSSSNVHCTMLCCWK